MKKLLKIRKKTSQHWVGDGFPVRSMFSYDEFGASVSPFLLLDYAGPAKFEPTERPRGVGEHPHRGFETVTIVYQGEVEHRDSAGNAGKIGPGDVQWMTAASGVVHEEMQGRDFTRNGGVLEMVQLWVNLPRELKMSKPRYQEILHSRIPTLDLPDAAGSARIIAGELLGTKGPANTHTPVNLWDLQVKDGAKLDLPVPQDHPVELLVLRGSARFSPEEEASAGELAFFDPKGSRLALEARGETRVLLMSGEPIREPIAGYGPFVMNTQGEIAQALSDYHTGKMGHLA